MWDAEIERKEGPGHMDKKFARSHLNIKNKVWFFYACHPSNGEKHK
jgi:hypothetical protein